MLTDNATIMKEEYIKDNWELQEILDLLQMPFNKLIFKTMAVHEYYFPDHNIQASTLLSIKTGNCPEDCKYCPQSAHYQTNIEKESLLTTEQVYKKAQQSKESGATRFCMGAAWRKLHDKDLNNVVDMVKQVKSLGLETCMTLGMITTEQAKQLKDAGLDYYNHNIDSSEEIYRQVITTRKYQDRLDTINTINQTGIKLCCGGIMGLGETELDRAKFLYTLANITPQPTSVPINRLVKVEGTPLFEAKEIDIFDFVRVIAVARIIMPKSYIRLSAGRETMSEAEHSLCFLAGANSIFFGEKLLTTPNPKQNADIQLLNKLGLTLEDNLT